MEMKKKSMEKQTTDYFNDQFKLFFVLDSRMELLIVCKGLYLFVGLKIHFVMSRKK
jgi:hypothetical protein